MNCDQWIQGRLCGATGARQYITGRCCPAHTPAAVAGRAEPLVDLERTLDYLRDTAGITWGFIKSDNPSSVERRRATRLT